VAQAFGLPPGRVDVISNGVDTEAFRPLDGVQREPNTILYVSNSEDRNKGARYLLEALRILRDEGRMWHLTVVDKRRQDLRLVPGLAEEFGMESRVTYASGLSTEQLASEYCRAQIVVSPSLYEGFGLPAAEAMACCAAVVATTAGAFPEVIEDGVSGLLVRPGDSQALAAAVRHLLDNPGLCWSLGQAARTRIVERFTWARAAEQLERIYEEAIQSRRGAA
jgi:glycosyltransferase involved in cell wall biosynthesis